MSDNDWELVENRPWAAARHRGNIGCRGEDFVKYRPLVPLKFFWNEGKQVLRGVARFSSFVEGPPGRAHGASIAMVFDEMLAYPVWRRGVSAVTANLSVSYKAALPLCSTAHFECRIVKHERRKYFVEGKITHPKDENKVYAVGKALFISIKSEPGMAMRSYL